MKPHLTDEEIWVLRCIDLLTESGRSYVTLGLDGAFSGRLPEYLLNAKGRPRIHAEAINHAHALEEYKLIEAEAWHTGGGFLGITGEGRQWLWDHDNPDQLKKLQDWARRHKVVTWAVAFYFVLGAAGGLFALGLNIASLIKGLLKN